MMCSGDLHPAKLCLLQGSPAKQGALFLHVALLQIHSSPHVQTEVATSRDASESIGENQGTHFEGMHSISIALSGSTALVVAIIIVLWCFLYKKKLTCCKSRDPVVSYQMQPTTSSSHFIPMPTLQPTAVPQPSAIIPMSSFQPTPAPQPTAVDLEAQVSRLSAQLLLHQQMLQRGPHPDAVSVNPPAQRAIENKYPVV